MYARLGRNGSRIRCSIAWICASRPVGLGSIGEGFLYFGFVEDMASRRILGMSMASHMRTQLGTGFLVPRC